MSFRDKMEVGLKPDAPYRPDNLPKSEQVTARRRQRKAAAAAANNRNRRGKTKRTK